MTFEIKSVSGKSILFVMAVEAEYGPFLRSRIDPLMTGVGPVEAAVALTRTLSKLEEESQRPDLVVSLGSAGSARLEQTEIYQASSVSYRDMDASPLGFEKGRTPFLDLPAALELPLRIPGIPTASLSTGANIVSGPAYDGIDADMVDMETFAVARACARFAVPLMGLRGISDGPGELAHLHGWLELLGLLDERLSAAVDLLPEALAKGL